MNNAEVERVVLHNILVQFDVQLNTKSICTLEFFYDFF
jgi:hypothetical protein